MLDPKSPTVEITINGRDFAIKQSPGILQSSREGGTTGAALWRTSIRFAGWLASPKNALFEHGIFDGASTVLELGAGIAGLTSAVLAPRVQRVVATDQQYALKLLRDNFQDNAPASGKGKKEAKHAPVNIDVAALDWETDCVPGFLAGHGLSIGVEAVVACDCVYNYALVKPLTQTCVEICRARGEYDAETGESRATMVIVAQQLRQPEVFEEWMKTFMQDFKVWRLPAEMLSQDLGEGSGFCVHIAVLK